MAIFIVMMAGCISKEVKNEDFNDNESGNYIKSFNISFDNSSKSELTEWADGTTGTKTVQIALGDILN
ncbi:MAG: hypothetical protein IJQ66_00790, partial [Clostridia bacterium]|nr:hypothetical protein [Clostridia bacterium]